MVKQSDIAECFDWRSAYSSVISDGVYRSSPEDFRVNEQLSFDLSQDGEHCFLLIEKKSANTQWVAKQLAKLFEVKQVAVGYAGLKDRHSISQQWFSIHIPGQANPETLAPQEDFSVVRIERNNKKLKQGAISHNSFQLVLKNISGEQEQINQRLALIQSNGVPNYFGMQRFGHHGANVEKAAKLLRGELRMKRSQRSIYLSALRSWFFNQYLNKRIEQANWNSALNGDRLNLNGSRSYFTPDSFDQQIEERLENGDIHVAGPLPGEKFLQRDGDNSDQDTSINYEDIWRPYIDVLHLLDVGTDWRPLRVLPMALDWDWQSDNQLQLSFKLPSGSFATAVLKELGMLKDAFAVNSTNSENPK